MTIALSKYARVVTAVTITLFLLGITALLATETSIDAVRALVQDTGILGAAIFIALHALATTALTPLVLLSTVSALLFGWVAGGTLSLIAATLGATGSFAIAQWLGKDAVQHIVPAGFKQLQKQIKKHGIESVLMLRLVPAMPHNLLNYALGLTTMKRKHFVIGTAIGLAPIVFVTAYIAARVGEVVTAGQGLGQLLAPGAVLLGALLIIFVRKKLVSRRTQTHKKTA